MSVEILSVAVAVKKIGGYLNRDTLRPYFVIADGDTETEELKKHFGGFEHINISDFYAGDSMLDTDRLIEKLQSVETNAIVFGLGEYICRTGQGDILRSLQDRNFNGKVIFVCRGIAHLLERLADEDRKFAAHRLCNVGGKFSFPVEKPAVDIPVVDKKISKPQRKTDAGFEFFGV